MVNERGDGASVPVERDGKVESKDGRRKRERKREGREVAKACKERLKRDSGG